MEADSATPALATAPAMAQPNNTVYIGNLNEKITVDELKKSLYHVFGQFGKVLEVTAKKTLAMRGQAFVVFDDIAAATRSVRDMQAFNFYGKPMRVAYAKAKSDVVSQRDGSFVARPKRKTDGSEAPAASAAKQSKKSSSSSSSFSSAAPHAAAAPRHSIVDEEVPPNAVLFVQNLPAEATHPMLVALFSPYDGFKEARMIEGKPGIAFVEFGTEFQSTRAMESLQGFKVTPQHAMDVSYAKK